MVSKRSFNRKAWFSHVFTTAGLRQSNLLSSTLGMACLGIKMIQTEYRLVSIGVSVDPAYIPSKNANMHDRCDRHPKMHTKREPYLKLMASVHLNMDCGVSVLGGPFRLCRFREPGQSSRQLLTTLFIHLFRRLLTCQIRFQPPSQ